MGDHAVVIPRSNSRAPGLHRVGWGRSLAVLVFSILVAVGALVTPAGAHAELDSTRPAAGSVAADGPQQVELTFTESVSVETDGVRVLDGAGRSVEVGPARARARSVTAPVREALADGGYVVAWRVVSADGHPIHGAFQFSVGQATAVDPSVAEEAFAASDRRDEILAAGFRAIAYLAVLMTAGMVLVGARLRREDEPSPVSPRLAIAATVGAVALVLQVPIRASLATGRGWGSVSEVGLLGRSLGDGMGPALAVTLLGLVLVAVTASLPFQGAVRVTALVGAVLAPLGFALTGHTRTMSPRLVGLVADLVHLAAAGVWFGGLMALVSVLARRRRAGDALGAGAAVAEFSGLAAGGLIAVAVTGMTMAVIEVGGPGAMTSTTYGRLLMAKVALVLVVAAGGGWNRLRLVPVLADHQAPAEGSDPRWNTLGRILRLEVVVLAVVLVITAVLVNVTPAVLSAERPGQTPSGTPGAVTSTSTTRPPDSSVGTAAQLGDGTVRVRLTPGRAGANSLEIELNGVDGTPDDRYEEVSVSFSLPSLDVGPIEARAEMTAPGRFRVEQADLAIAGTWTVSISVQPDRFTKVDADLTLEVGAS